MAITANSLLEIKPGHRLQWEETQDCFVILFPEGMVQLSASAGEIMQLCDGGKTVADIIEQLTEKFPGADLSGDVIEFFTEAEDNGWVQLK
jgi:pyrroloquinoline quinone biosynthesis protein D